MCDNGNFEKGHCSRAKFSLRDEVLLQQEKREGQHKLVAFYVFLLLTRVDENITFVQFHLALYI